MIRLTAHAKVNLYLEITGRRPDGYHTLSTVFQTISLGDELWIEPAAEISLTTSDPTLATDEGNLVMRAALLLQKNLKEKRGARIHLEKKVPMGAGLGGGSADAAATLKGLLRLWGKKLAASKLEKLAVSLGADVPFFLKGGLCSATGIGEKLKRLKPLPKTWMCLVWPGFGVSTKEAYAKVHLPFARTGRLRRPVRAAPTSEGCRGADPRKSLFNRFEPLVFPDHPEIPKLKDSMLSAGATQALMSGSGSSVFGLAKSQSHGAQILSLMQKTYNHCWLVHTV